MGIDHCMRYIVIRSVSVSILTWYSKYPVFEPDLASYVNCNQLFEEGSRTNCLKIVYIKCTPDYGQYTP